MTTKTRKRSEEWALVELFSHEKIAGKIDEAAIAGVTFVRVEIPAVGAHQGMTRFFNPSAISSITPMSRAVIEKLVVAGIHAAKDGQ